MTDIVKRLRNPIRIKTDYGLELDRREAADRIEQLQALLREAYDGRQKPMTVGLCYRIGHALNHVKADQPDATVDRPWQEIVKHATRYLWLRERINWRDTELRSLNTVSRYRSWEHRDYRPDPPESEHIDEYIDGRIASETVDVPR